MEGGQKTEKIAKGGKVRGKERERKRRGVEVER